MIIFDRVTAESEGRNRGKPVLRAAEVVIPSGRRIALVGASRDDARTLFSLLSGHKHPLEGHIVRKASVSFPVGYIGGFLKSASVRANVAYLARLYGADIKATVSFIHQASRLQKAFDKPYGDLNKKAQRKLAAILAYTIPFDIYLLSQDDVRGKMNRGNVALHLFTQRNRSAGMIISTSDPAFAAQYCDIALVLNEQKLTLHESIDEAFQVVPKRRPKKPARAAESDDDETSEDEQLEGVAMNETPKDAEDGKLSRQERLARRAERQEQVRLAKEAKADRPSKEERIAQKAARQEQAKLAREQAGGLSREERLARRAERQEAKQARGAGSGLSDEERQARRAARKEERQRLRSQGAR